MFGRGGDSGDVVVSATSSPRTGGTANELGGPAIVVVESNVTPGREASRARAAFRDGNDLLPAESDSEDEQESSSDGGGGASGGVDGGGGGGGVSSGVDGGRKDRNDGDDDGDDDDDDSEHGDKYGGSGPGGGGGGSGGGGGGSGGGSGDGDGSRNNKRASHDEESGARSSTHPTRGGSVPARPRDVLLTVLQLVPDGLHTHVSGC